MTLFSYNIPVDDGAAPNPFWGICTLAICKPAIRRTARVGDWIMATGSARYGLTNQLVYVMNVSAVMTMQEYDLYCKTSKPDKIPLRKSKDPTLWVGDSIYDYSVGTPVQRRSVHTPNNIPTDLGGKNVLLSDDFWYFGMNTMDLPSHLLTLAHNTQGHKAQANDQLKQRFVDWIQTIPKPLPGAFRPYGLQNYLLSEIDGACGETRYEEDLADEEFESKGC